MAYIPELSNLEQKHWKTMTPRQGSGDGIITQILESGIPNSLLMYHDEAYDLILQYLTKQQVIDIKLGILNIVKNEHSQLTLPSTKAVLAGYFDYSSQGGDPTLIITGRTTISRVTGTDYWTLTIPLQERFE
jgi:hypothetical protein